MRAASLLALVPPLAVSLVAAHLARPWHVQGTLDAKSRSRVLYRTGQVALRRPEVLVVGNSLAQTDIDPGKIGRALGSTRSLVLSEPNSAGPTWFVLLKDHVYGQGVAPSTVVIVGTSAAMLAPKPWDPKGTADLMALASETEDLERRLFGGDPVERSWNRFRARGSLVRSGLVTGWRDTLVGLGSGEVAAPWQAGGELLREAYGTTAVAVGGAAKAIELPRTEDSFVPDTVALARANGSDLVYVLLPVRDPDRMSASVETERAFVAWLNDHEVKVVDLRDGLVSLSDFTDEAHLNGEGRRKVSDRLAEELARYDRVGPEPAPLPQEAPTVTVVAPDPAPHRYRSRRHVEGCSYLVAPEDAPFVPTEPRDEGSMPPLPIRVSAGAVELRPAFTGEGRCVGSWRTSGGGLLSVKLPAGTLTSVIDVRPAGDAPAVSTKVPGEEVRGVTDLGRDVGAYWVLPGGRLTARFPEGWRDPGDALRIRSSVVIVGGGARPSLVVGGAPAALHEDGRVLRALAPVPDGDDAFEVVWTTPPDGPWLLVRDLALEGDRAAEPIGRGDLSEVRIDLLDAEPRFQRPPPRLAGGVLAGVDEGLSRGWLVGPLPRRDDLVEALGVSACVPAEAEIDGAPARVVQRGALLATFHGAPASAGAEVVVRLNEDRRCHWFGGDGDEQRRSLFGPSPKDDFRGVALRRRALRALWLYPGDDAHLAREAPLELQATARALELSASSLGSPTGLTVELRAGGQLRQSWRIPPVQLDGAPRRLPLDRPLWRSDGALDLRLVAEGHGFVHLAALALVEGRIDEPATPSTVASGPTPPSFLVW